MQPNPVLSALRRAVRGAAGAAALVALGSAAPAAPAPAAKPNVLIFFIDDLGRTDIGFDGSTFHETPRLDAWAKTGVRFTDFYSANPVCSPTRAALMTGKQPHRLGITDWIAPNTGIMLSARETTLGEAFKAAGYQTAYVGKWHLGETDADQPQHHGFDWIKGVNRGGAPGSYHFPYKRPPGKAKGKAEAPAPTTWDVPDLAHGKPGDYLTDALTTETIAFLKQRDRQRPFFLCFGHYAVHTPIQPPAGLAQKYQAKRQQLHGTSETPVIPAPYAAVSRGRQDDPDYAAMMENLDTNIGRLLDALDQLGQRENTIVILTSDNGGLCTLARGRPGPTTNLPFRSGKGWTYEGGIRIPTVIAWPAGLKPRVTAVPAYTADFYPTLLELAGLAPRPDQHLDGRSLARVLREGGDPALQDRPLVWYYPHDHGSGHKPSAALRRGPWKIVHRLPDGPTELFNLADDPGETTDLAARQPERTAALRAELVRWIAQTKAPNTP